MKGRSTAGSSGAGLHDDVRHNLGNELPLLGGSGRRAPDRRRVSLRWMLGSILTGVSSLLLMGGALYAALDGRQQLALPASKLNGNLNRDGGEAQNGNALKGDRPISIVSLEPVSERVLQVPTVTKVGDSNVIRKRPFAYASAPLAVSLQRSVSYPPFNPLTVFRASGSDNASASSDVIYGADIENEVRLQQIVFDTQKANYDASAQISAREAEMIVREARSSLVDGQLQLAALPYLDTSRFALKQEDISPTTGLDIKIVAENVSTAEVGETKTTGNRLFDEEVITVRPKQTLSTAVSGLNLQAQPLGRMIEALNGELGIRTLPKGTKLRVAWEQLGDPADPATVQRFVQRISVYRAGNHIKSIALDDKGSVVWANTPVPIEAIAAETDNNSKPTVSTVARNNLPNIYDGIFRAALSQGLNAKHARRIVRTIAFDVDFRSTINPKDSLEVFFSIEDGLEEATDKSEILYVGLTQGGQKRNYFRFKAGDDGSLDYYDENGKSAKKFLLRKPVPNGKFGSPFGPRRHPISRVVKMHHGVDLSAPRGTPIIAAGNGIVESAKWNAGYGRQTIIRHANGYKTSYNHQHRFAKGIKAGARVLQGQIIGQVGSTGYSTGPHLHYEVIVNGNKVNPMRIRLPKGRVLKGDTLASFKRERNRINALLNKGRGADQTVAFIN